MIRGRPQRGTIDFGLEGPIPRDILLLLGALFVTFSLDALVPGGIGFLRLTPDIWLSGALWQLITYPLAAVYGSALGLIISLWVILVFGKQVFFFVGRKAFWRTFFSATVIGGVVAVLVQVILGFTGLATTQFLPFGMMAGQFAVMTVLITGFATLYGNATIYLFFVLPVPARYFIGIEILFAFLSFLASKDFAGFMGVCATVAAAYFLFSGVRPSRLLHEMKLRVLQKWLRFKLKRSRKGSGSGDVVQGPWVN